MCDQVRYDTGGHAPDHMALPDPHRDLHPAPGPGVVPGNAHGFIGEVLRHMGDQVIGVALRRGGAEKVQRDGIDRRHLGGGGPQGGKAAHLLF